MINKKAFRWMNRPRRWWDDFLSVSENRRRLHKHFAESNERVNRSMIKKWKREIKRNDASLALGRIIAKV
jgi:hypothetical protein